MVFIPLYTIINIAYALKIHEKYTKNTRKINITFIYRDAYALKIRQKWTKNKPGSERSERIMDEIYAIYTRKIHEKYTKNTTQIDCVYCVLGCLGYLSTR
jgi:hypothetical protein